MCPVPFISSRSPSAVSVLIPIKIGAFAMQLDKDRSYIFGEKLGAVGRGGQYRLGHEGVIGGIGMGRSGTNAGHAQPCLGQRGGQK